MAPTGLLLMLHYMHELLRFTHTHTQKVLIYAAVYSWRWMDICVPLCMCELVQYWIHS